jgi:hypothetical protein
MVEVLFSAGSVDDTLRQVVSLAVSTIEGCDAAGIFVFEHDVVSTPVCSDPVVMAIDALQQQTGEGPSFDAIRQQSAFYAEDLGVDPRWPRFGPSAEHEGMRSLLALPLLFSGVPGALNLSARFAHAFGVIDRGKGALLASIAGLAYASAQTHEDDERRTAVLHAALASRDVIGQAQGILMEREKISADDAFDILRRASQRLNIKLRDIAQSLVDTGERPLTE